MNKVNINEYAFTSNVVLEDRIEIYGSKDKIKFGMIQITNKLIPEILKINSVNTSVILSFTVNTMFILKLFLGNMTAICLFLLVMLSTILIYSLMISDVDEKTFEFGMLRAIGF